MKRILFLIIISAVCVTMQKSHAQSGSSAAFGLTITPPVTQMQIKPGKSIILAFTIENTGANDLSVTAFFSDLLVDADTGAPRTSYTPAVFPYARLQNLDKSLNTPFVLPAGKTDQLVVKFEIPSTMSEREYNLTLMLQGEPISHTTYDQIGNKNRASAVGFVGAHVLLSITHTGQDLSELIVDEVRASSFFDSLRPLTFRVFAFNQGKTRGTVQGTVRIKSMWTNQEETITILPEYVLAQSRRELRGSITESSLSQSTLPTLFSVQRAFFIGPQRIEVELTHDAGKASTRKTITVFAVPFSLLFLFFAGSGLWILRVYLKKYTQKNTEINH
ncbi:MAG: hypothetical protein UX04_C0008G0007 [Microgenomates group bacterium GW2011_GWF2_45_18]|nr:MAG: hypothetical protein UW18_C0008G0013 [Microgenomates group bacterium GW2011_GWF1_44_10]KKU01395.1 MAG: hypothetical protein UX04_C0008G0007 [Microgenomates group bacterium GW2011_GWF2_45_18]HAU99341.1 hypothetical protein [Candidatus Paceibacterota bacterium]HAX01945.1 hypothetical protein [Candidatus Paceibacterota bacterium]